MSRLSRDGQGVRDEACRRGDIGVVIVKLTAEQRRWGYFTDPETGEPLPDDQPVIAAEWLRDGRYMRILRPAIFHDPDGRDWIVEVGALVNGLSTPRFFWRESPPYTGKAREASVFHDVACGKRLFDSPIVHQMFYRVMRANGVGPWVAWTRWAAVRVFGPRFKAGDKRAKWCRDLSP